MSMLISTAGFQSFRIIEAIIINVISTGDTSAKSDVPFSIKFASCGTHKWKINHHKILIYANARRHRYFRADEILRRAPCMLLNGWRALFAIHSIPAFYTAGTGKHQISHQSIIMMRKFINISTSNTSSRICETRSAFLAMKSPSINNIAMHKIVHGLQTACRRHCLELWHLSWKSNFKINTARDIEFLVT